MEYVALHVKTCYSLLSSLNRIDKLVSKAKKLGYTSLAITDTNNMFGVIEFYLECLKNDIKPIIGLEIDNNNINVLLYAKNNLGYQHLLKLSTILSERNISLEDLSKYQDNLILVMDKDNYVDDIYKIFNDKYLLSKSDLHEVLYLEPNDYEYLDYLLMIRDNKILGNYELNTYQNKYLLDINNLPSTNSIFQEIVNKCTVTIEYQSGLLPIYDKSINEFEYLTNLCQKGLCRRLSNNIPTIYQERLDYELKIINQMGFCNYFLIVWDYVKYAKFHNILVGPGRGSAAGSLVSYTLGITDIDPLKYNLLFERFLNPERVTMPDIDIDFDGEKRNEVIKYVIDKYGQKNVCGIITFNTMAAKQVIRDVARVMNINLSLVDQITKLIEDDLTLSYKNNLSLRNIINSSSQLTKLYKVATKLEGLPRHISIHAAGIVMSNQPLDNVIPLYKTDEIYLTGYSMNYLENLGLLKMDFLSLSNLTTISKLINEIKEKEHLNITFNNIPIDDNKAFDIFKKVETTGIFQFESAGMKQFLQKFKVENFDDLTAALALFRPGPMNNIDLYIERRKGRNKINYLHPDLEDILKDTYGIIIYQEQIMQIAQKMAGYTLGEADILRRAMSKKKEYILLEGKNNFIKRAVDKGYEEKIATDVYELILKFANYGFNKAHSVSYTIIAVKMAFLKRYFFTYYMANMLTNVISSQGKTKEYLQEVKQHQIEIIKPNINSSTNEYQVIDNSLLCPFTIIKNIGILISREIIHERTKGKYQSFLDFVTRNYSSSINKKVITSLILADCFRDFSYNQKTLLENLDNIINYLDLIKDESLIKIEVPEMIYYEEFDLSEKNQNELEMFGFYLGNHPVSKYKSSDNIDLNRIKLYYDKTVELIVIIDRIKEVMTKNNDIMAFITASDEYDSISLTFFPKVYQNANDLDINKVVKIFGKVEKRYDKYQIIVNKYEILD